MNQSQNARNYLKTNFIEIIICNEDPWRRSHDVLLRTLLCCTVRLVEASEKRNCFRQGCLDDNEFRYTPNRTDEHGR